MDAAGEFADIVRRVEREINVSDWSDPSVRAYMIARAALLWVAKTRTSKDAADLAYAIADELATANDA